MEGRIRTTATGSQAIPISKRQRFPARTRSAIPRSGRTSRRGARARRSHRRSASSSAIAASGSGQGRNVQETGKKAKKIRRRSSLATRFGAMARAARAMHCAARKVAGCVGGSSQAAVRSASRSRIALSRPKKIHSRTHPATTAAVSAPSLMPAAFPRCETSATKSVRRATPPRGLEPHPSPAVCTAAAVDVLHRRRPEDPPRRKPESRGSQVGARWDIASPI